jgi:hypothetical protein
MGSSKAADPLVPGSWLSRPQFHARLVQNNVFAFWNEELVKSHSSPPDGLPRYRLLTGKDDAEFCRQVSDAIALGYELHGSPAATFNGEHVVVAQAIVWLDPP